MRYEDAQQLNAVQFRRLTGVKPCVFEQMAAVVREAHAAKKARGGRPNKISVENMLMLTLEYYREYRTYFHIATSYGISESYVCKVVRWVEETLIRSGKLSLPGKKALASSDVAEAVLIDATESPIERPQKNKGTTIPGRRNATR